MTENTAIREMTIESSTVALLNASEIDRQIATAKKYPRSITQTRAELMTLATLNEKTATECMYALPRKSRDGKETSIEGASVRFAELLLSSWKNARAGSRVVSDDGEFITAQGVFHDLENNTSITREVQRRVVGSDGRRYSGDMIATTANAACSIAMRNAILQGIPKALWVEAYDEARKVVLGDAKTLSTRRMQALATMQKFGLNDAECCELLDVHGIDDIGLEELVLLHGICSSLRNGETTTDQLLRDARGDAEPIKTSATSEKIRASAQSKKAAEPKPAEEAKPANAAPMTKAESDYLNRITMVGDADSEELLKHIEGITTAEMSERQQQIIKEAIDNKREKLKGGAK